jgi:glycosyltransferase involved in cell wall biosynthesis
VNNNVSGVLMTGFQIALLAGFDYAVQCDGDGQHPVNEIERLLEEAKAHHADLLIASRFASDGTNGDTLASTTLLRRSGSLILVALAGPQMLGSDLGVSRLFTQNLHAPANSHARRVP